MPRMVARLIPALVIIAGLYGFYLLGKMYKYSDLSKKDRTRLLFALIIAIAGAIILFATNISSG